MTDPGSPFHAGASTPPTHLGRSEPTAEASLYAGWHKLPLALYEHGESSGNAYNSWGFNIEDLFNYETDAFNRHGLKVLCPGCRRKCSPLCSPLTVSIGGGWRWVGLDHQEPYTDHKARCPGCKEWYRFTTYLPQ